MDVREEAPIVSKQMGSPKEQRLNTEIAVADKDWHLAWPGWYQRTCIIFNYCIRNLQRESIVRMNNVISGGTDQLNGS